MLVKLPVSTLLPALRAASAVADRKSTMPILANVCLRADDRGLTIAATDLNVTAITTIPLIGSKPGGLTVNAKTLADIVANAPPGDVALERVENSFLSVKATKAGGKKLEHRIVGLPDRDFPKVPDHREATFCEVDAVALDELIDRTFLSICQDETRFHLCGILFESNGATARMVATDGHRLSKADRKLTGPVLSQGVIIPKLGAIQLRKILDGATAVRLAVRLPYLFVEREGSLLAVKLIDAQFPPYNQVIPGDPKTSAIVEREALADAVDRCGLMTSEVRGIRLTISADGIALASDNPDLGDVREELDAEVRGPDITIGCAAKYLRDALGVLACDQVSIDCTDPLAPIAIRPVASTDDYVGVVMPMRI